MVNSFKVKVFLCFFPTHLLPMLDGKFKMDKEFKISHFTTFEILNKCM